MPGKQVLPVQTGSRAHSQPQLAEHSLVFEVKFAGIGLDTQLGGHSESAWPSGDKSS